jgi:predicted metalloprotease
VRWQDLKRSGNVEDRRGLRMPGGPVGGQVGRQLLRGLLGGLLGGARRR